MKFIKKILIGLILMFCFCFLNVKAISVDNFPNTLSTISEGDKLSPYGDTATWFHYKYNSSYAVICTEINNETTPVGHSCTLTDNWSNEIRVGVAAIIEAADLPAGNAVDATDKENYYYAQTTINRFIYNMTDNEINQVNSDYTSSTFLAAANAAVDRYNASFNVTLSSSTLTLTASGDYYISPVITVNGTYLTSSTVTTSGHLEVYDKTTDADKTFRVRIAKSYVEAGELGPFTVTATGKKNYTVARNYNCGSSVQTVTPNITKTLYATDAATATASIPTGSIQVTKKNESGANLAGAVLRLYKGTTLIEEWTSTTSAHLIEGLLASDDYKIVEVSAPIGYVKSSDISVTVTADNTTTINVTDNSIELTINKVDTKNDSQLITVGTAQFKLYYLDDANEEVSTTISTTNGTVKITDSSAFKLIAGKTYYLKELSAPTGYALNTEILSFTMEANDTQKVDFGNFSTKLIINKYIKNTTTFLKDAKISVCRYNDDTKLYDICEVYTTEDKALVINSLPLAKYQIKETEAPSGYILDATVYDIEITEENNEQTVTIYDEEIIEEVPKTGVNIWILTGSSILLISVGSFLYIKNKKKFN